MKFLSPPLSRLTCALALGALPAWAQTNPPVQKVTGPNARYWVSAEVSSGLSMASMQSGGGIASMMAAAMGGSGPRKSLRLELGSVRAANPAEATHAIPTALGMGASLPLLGERAAAATPEPVERDIPDTREMGDKPKGRMLFFWGCGESAGTGQPVILDFAQLANGVVPPNMRSVAIRAQRSGPALGRDRGFAEWPNRKDSTGVPAQASLVGEHRVSGGFVPDIRFQVGAAHDFMDALSMQQAPSPGGGHRLAWNPVRTALGYFANGMGFKQGEGDGGDIVFWNSSSARLLGGEQLIGFLPPAETDRLVRDKVVLPPGSTECVVPKEVVAAAGGPLMMVNLNAYGPELNVVFPPRPEDPKIDWNQEYAVKLRQRSYTGAVGGMSGPGESARSRPREGTAPTEGAPAEAKPNVTEAAKSILKGIFGR
jgi:hypothetical protein